MAKRPQDVQDAQTREPDAKRARLEALEAKGKVLQDRTSMRLAIVAHKCGIIVTTGNNYETMAQAWEAIYPRLSPAEGYASFREGVQLHGYAKLDVWPHADSYGECMRALSEELSKSGRDLRWRIEAVASEAEPRYAAPICVSATMREHPLGQRPAQAQADEEDEEDEDE